MNRNAVGAFLCAAAILWTSFTAAGSEPLRVLFLSGANEYDSDQSLSAFKTAIESKYNVECTILSGKEASLNNLPDLSKLEQTDVFVIFCRRFTLPKDQLDLIKKYVMSGKPVVGVRTASHAFQDWLEMDKTTLGGNYHNHYGDEPANIIIEEKAVSNPVLAGLTAAAFTPTRKVYKNTGLAADDTVLLTAKNEKYSEPAAWTREVNGGRVFYTSLGTQQDFLSMGFNQMLINAIYWTAKRTPEPKHSNK